MQNITVDGSEYHSKAMENNTHLDFVIKHFRQGVFDPDRSIGQFWQAVGRGRIVRLRAVAGRIAAAAAVVAVVLAGLSVHLLRMNAWEETAESIVILPDRSTVYLRDGSTLAFQPRRFGKERVVRVDGTAYFEVARKDGASFEVRSDEAFVRVLGTKFQFDAVTGSVDVTEGRVLFAKAGSEEGIILTKGKSASLVGGIPAPRSPELVNPAYWATKTLVYEDTPIRQVLYELSEIFGRELILKHAKDSDLRLTGEFRVEDGLENILSIIESALGVKITVK